MSLLAYVAILGLRRKHLQALRHGVVKLQTIQQTIQKFKQKLSNIPGPFLWTGTGRGVE